MGSARPNKVTRKNFQLNFTINCMNDNNLALLQKMR